MPNRSTRPADRPTIQRRQETGLLPRMSRRKNYGRRSLRGKRVVSNHRSTTSHSNIYISNPPHGDEGSIPTEFAHDKASLDTSSNRKTYNGCEDCCESSHARHAQAYGYQHTQTPKRCAAKHNHGQDPITDTTRDHTSSDHDVGVGHAHGLHHLLARQFPPQRWI